ncbi:MAG: TIGR01906 family membrane protein, partial [Anaerolineales bacterium]|nr:TIGR01906 family membrane protein [Anaerolineales bacterium]
MPNRLTQILKLLIISLITIFIVGGAVQLLATDPYLALEYGKASFPPDPFGYTQQERFDLASSNIHYVRAHLPSDALSNQTLNGAPVYTSREVSHMADVQAVFQSVSRVWQAVFILLILLGFFLWKKGERKVLASAIQSGGLLTSGIILSIALLAIFAWQFWFETFHLFFFKPGSWLFSYSDTLIRLFPVEFWFDATLTISVMSLVGGLLLALVGWRGKRVLAEMQA